MKRNFQIIDMTCSHCGGTSKVKESLKSMVVDRSKRGRLEFYVSDESQTPIEIECEYCHNKISVWQEGSEGRLANVNSLVILGDVSGTNIVIGNNNRF